MRVGGCLSCGRDYAEGLVRSARMVTKRNMPTIVQALADLKKDARKD